MRQHPFKPFEGAEDVFFSQNDPLWAEIPYWESNVSDVGCGLCSFAMAVDILTGARLTPADLYELRKSWGLAQRHDDDGDICARDAHEDFNPLFREHLGVESSFLHDKSLESFRSILEKGDAVIWFSSRDWGEPWIWADGSKSKTQYERGHLVCAWKYCDGCFYIKDPNGTKDLGNNVAYDHVHFQKLLDGVLENRYVMRAC